MDLSVRFPESRFGHTDMNAATLQPDLAVSWVPVKELRLSYHNLGIWSFIGFPYYSS